VADNDKKKPFNNAAFAGLQKIKEQLASDVKRKEDEKRAEEAAAKARAARREVPKETEADAFLRAMSGVKRIDDDGRGQIVRKEKKGAEAPLPPNRAQEEVEALVDLASTVDPEGALEDQNGAAYSRGLDIRIVKKLTRGEFPIDARIDLHGLRKFEVDQKVEAFIKQARANKYRLLLIITGKGTHSEGGPVIKDAVYGLLTRGAMVRNVLALSPAQPEHGGDGAYYVLLRRR
jgi:DNA-nicking Smr family endonuclease